MAGKGVSDQEFFCFRSEFLTNEIILMDKENLYQDKRNSQLPRTHVPPESPIESLSFFSNNSNFLVPPFSAGPRIPEKAWPMTSPVVPNGGSLVLSPPVTPVGNSQGQIRNFTPVIPSNVLPGVHNGTVWGHQQAGGRFGNGGYEYEVMQAMAWGGPQVQNQRRSYGGVDVTPVGYGGGIRRECAGTGVFLPRSYHNTTPESRKKTGGSTPQPPRRVRAQKKKFENATPQLQSQRHFIASAHIPENEPVMARGDAALAKTTTSNPTTTTTTSAEGMALDNELRLPQEWTY